MIPYFSTLQSRGRVQTTWTNEEGGVAQIPTITHNSDNSYLVSVYIGKGDQNCPSDIEMLESMYIRPSKKMCNIYQSVS